MEPQGLSVEEPTLSNTLEKFLKSMNLLINDHKGRSDRSGRTENSGLESIPLQSDGSALFPPVPAPGVESGMYMYKLLSNLTVVNLGLIPVVTSPLLV